MQLHTRASSYASQQQRRCVVPAAACARRRRNATAAPSGRSAPARALSGGGGPAADAALILEADGALCDLVMDGHRAAFNAAFAELGLECTNWPPPLYNDLLARSDGTGEGLVAAYFSRIGWPLSVGKGEEPVFAAKVHELKQRQFDKMLRAGKVPLRADVAAVIADAAAAGAAVAVIAETASAPSEDVAGACLAQLPEELRSVVRVYSAGLHAPPEDEGDDDGEAGGEGGSDIGSGGSGGGGGGGGAGAFRAAAARVQRRAAEDFVARLQRDAPPGAASVGLHPALQQGGGAQRLAPAWLGAVALTLGVPAARCVVVASSGGVVEAAAQAGMVAVAVPRRGAPYASYEGAAARFEGFGVGLATWRRLSALLPPAAAKAPSSSP